MPETRLARLLEAVGAMRHTAGRMAFAGDLNVSFGQDLFRIAPVVNRADLSVPEIVRAVSGMTDWPRVIRELCEFRSDLFHPREEAVVELLAFLDTCSAAQPDRAALADSVRRLFNHEIRQIEVDHRRVFRKVTDHSTDKELPAEAAADLIPDYELLCKFIYIFAHLTAQLETGAPDAARLRQWCAENRPAMQIPEDRLREIREQAEADRPGGRRHLVVRVDDALYGESGRKQLWIWEYLDSRSAVGSRPAQREGRLVVAPDEPMTMEDARVKLGQAIDACYDAEKREPVVEVVLSEDGLKKEDVENWPVPPPSSGTFGQNIVGQNIVGQNIVGQNIVGQDTIGQDTRVPLGRLVPVVVRPLTTADGNAAGTDQYRRWTDIFARRKHAADLTHVMAAHNAVVPTSGDILCVAAGPGIAPEQIPQMLSSAWQVGIRLMIWHRLGDYRNGILNRRPLDELPEYLFAQRRNPEGRGYVLVWDNPYWVPDYDRRRLRWSSGGSSI